MEAVLSPSPSAATPMIATRIWIAQGDIRSAACWSAAAQKGLRD
jgi:hypothetical protein